MIDILSTDKKLRDAIARRRLLRLRYNDAVRLIEPHDYGLKNGKPMLLAYQLQPRKSAAEWRLFDVAKIADCLVLEDTFKGSRGALDQRHHAWDTLYARVD